MEYTTEKRVNKESNQILAGIFLVGMGLISLFFKNYYKFPSFEFWGDMLNTFFLVGFGIYINRSASKRIIELKGESFCIEDKTFCFNKKDEKYVYSEENPLSEIVYSSDKIIIRGGGGVHEINLVNYALKYEDLQVLKSQIMDLSSFMKIQTKD